MALRECCDAFATAKNVKVWRITVEEIPAKVGKGTEVALCPRGKDRLDKFIARGTAPPNPSKETETPA